jgi:hypothetical protein
MNGPRLSRASLTVAAALLAPAAAAENVDPAGDGSQYAYAENFGWINAEPSGDGGPGIQVGDSELSGWMWSENIGWIGLSCENTSSCTASPYGVTNDGGGVLSGYAWSENAGWLSFSCSNTASCGVAAYGVSIDPSTGDFHGRAWGENAGWITFASPGPVPFQLRSGWVCAPPPLPPAGTPLLTVAKTGGGRIVSWSPAAGATGHDIVTGDLDALRAGAGDFAAATIGCLDDNRTTTTLLDAAPLAPGQGEWFLVRGQNCGGNGSYDSGGSAQTGARDGEIAASGSDCP